ncbi:unnamed protein product [Diatraea saccharalis]|uniref:Uncharacterized protein n=1 Tax=Diatraea saccharalis TaxID=40085 RepID=A0A9N9RFL7_9NEOP|nr:unnamed protein product [Diatraea saccharalis]
MAKLILLCATLIASARCAVLNIGDVTHQRLVRSPCYTCGQQSIVPPPPPVVRTENWSGLARSADGLQNTIFSGAAAAADQGAQTTGEAFSLASSAVNGVGAGLSGGHTSGYGSTRSSIDVKTGIHTGNSGSGQLEKGANTYGGQVVGSYRESSSSYHNGGFKHDGGEELQQTSNKDAGFGSTSYADQSGNDGNKNIARSDYSGYANKNSNENRKVEGTYHFNTQQTQVSGIGIGSANDGRVDRNYEVSRSNSASDNFENQGGHYISDYQRGYGSFSSLQSGSFGGYGQSGSDNYSNGRGYAGYQQSRSHELQYGGPSLSSGNIQRSSDAGQQLQTSEFGSSSHGKYGVGTFHESETSGQGQSVQKSNTGLQADLTGSASIDAQSALSGALNLASQGLQTAQHTGCSTCGKSSYALSNSKSRTGSAVAVSIGG